MRESSMENREQFVMDDLDHAIFERLQSDGRKPFAEIGRELGVSLNTVRAHYKRMVDSGALRIISAIDPHQMGFAAFANVYVKVEPQHLESGCKQMIEFSEVTWLAEMTGPFDLAIDVCCRDMDHLHEFVTQQLHKIEGVRETQTSIYFRIHKAMSLPVPRSLWSRSA